MAFRPIIRQRLVSPLAITTLAAGVLLWPHTTLHAEAPPEEYLARKPIYDDLALIREPAKPSQPSQPSQPSNNDSSTRSPTYTNRLAGHIGQARGFVYAHTLVAEDRVNVFMSSVLHQEKAFTQTIASLAPPPQSQERIMPGALYVLVAAMTGSIISRNRNILLRASAPLALGLGAAWIVLPITTRNVGDLVWTYEERAPLIAENHMRIRGAVEEGWRQAKTRGEAIRQWSDEVVGEGRETVEAWVRKGK